jgi:hypothetical protein
MTRFSHAAFPTLSPPAVDITQSPAKPVLPDRFTATAVLHPYSPAPHDDDGSTPFFELCTASISFVSGQVLSACLVGAQSGDTWWYKITPSGVQVSRDKGASWAADPIQWSLPGTDWLGGQASYFQTGFLTWMQAQSCQWWKQPVAGSNATTWTWFDDATGLPFRMMFGAPPPTPTTADPGQLALFQNFSFTYFPNFQSDPSPVVDTWVQPVIDGFSGGNPNGWKLPVWNSCFAMSTLMTPVDSASLPLPTVVLYQWKPDADYQAASDRAQATIMSYRYNPQAGFSAQVAQLYGVAPSGVTPPPLAGSGYLYNEIIFLVRGAPDPFVISCQNLGLGAQPPDWARIPAVEGAIHATISNNPALCPGHQIADIAVLFPPTREYPQGRYLWTWYSPPPGSDGTQARPVTSMESASTIAEGGTSLALADYFDYAPSPSWFPPSYFDLPALCLSKEADAAAGGGAGVNRAQAPLAHAPAGDPS